MSNKYYLLTYLFTYLLMTELTAWQVDRLALLLPFAWFKRTIDHINFTPFLIVLPWMTVFALFFWFAVSVKLWLFNPVLTLFTYCFRVQFHAFYFITCKNKLVLMILAGLGQESVVFPRGRPVRMKSRQNENNFLLRARPLCYTEGYPARPALFLAYYHKIETEVT